jgi:orotidine-5'-phosphate decarboxylase
VHDQARTGTPFDAARRGADVIVIGRTVTAADDPERVANLIARGVANQ